MYIQKETKMKNQNATKVKFFEKVLDNILNIGYNITNNKYFGRNTMANAKNYTEEMVSEMTTAYTENPTRDTVDALAHQFGKTTRSIIAKLSREGVYIAQPRTTKSGEPVVAKAELVAQIQEHFGIELPTLVKAGKADLQRLVDSL
jgi:hypothetical protein